MLEFLERFAPKSECPTCKAHWKKKKMVEILYWGIFILLLYMAFFYMPELAGRECCECMHFNLSVQDLNLVNSSIATLQSLP